MNQLVLRIIAIIFSASVVVAFVYWIGETMENRKPEILATETINQMNNVDSALQIYKSEKGKVVLGDYNETTNPNGTPTFKPLVDEGYLKKSALDLNWNYDTQNGYVQKTLGKDELAKKACSRINHMRNGTPEDLEPPKCDNNVNNLLCCLND
tara:strand:- start:378 stop:836 length:459 start_codon:yes stop_codon:yes gene_type:complete